jgi:4-hydroxy-tetrahydrodipicolinate synthase
MENSVFSGPWAGLPVAWDANDSLDERRYCDSVEKCCRAGVPGVYTGGTTGEFYAQSFEEFHLITEQTISVCRSHGVPVMIGCSSTYTRGSIRRAELAARLGADAIQVTLPFWMEVSDSGAIGYFKDVSAASGNVPLSIYETTRCKVALTLDQHRRIHDAVPNYVMVKANESTIGHTAEGCAELSKFVNVFVSEHMWDELAAYGVAGSCSSIVYWSPPYVLSTWEVLKRGDFDELARRVAKIREMYRFLFTDFSERGFTDSAFDRLGAHSTGFIKTGLNCRAPYPSATTRDVELFRNWLESNFPEFLHGLDALAN